MVAGNSNGQIAFGGTLTGAGVTNSNNLGVWAGTAGDLELVARRGSQAPGLAPGVNFDGFVGLTTSRFTPTLSADGEVTFLADLVGPGISSFNDTALFSGTRDNLELILQAGQQMPGADPGVLFAGINTDTLSANIDGDLAFYAGVKGAASYAGIYTYIDGELELIMKIGDQIDVGSGELRTISELSLHGGVTDGYGSAWNGAGQLVYRAAFTDHSSAVIFAVVPEPSAGVLMLVGSLLAPLAVRCLRR
ncbi:MAG: hypothetical protein DWQ37_19845 [Planctomycetota bacterium]|nr:MAG: hypothetical protein DWQ37_19845 [Planctomycetota bacterium]